MFPETSAKPLLHFRWKLGRFELSAPRGQCPRAAWPWSMTKVEFRNNNLTGDSEERSAGRRRSIVEVIVDQKERGNWWSSGRHMRVKHGGLLGGINQNRRYPARGIPHHMLPHRLRPIGVRGNALRNRLMKSASRQTNHQGKHNNANESAAPRKR